MRARAWRCVSVAARSGSDGSVVGSVAASPVAVLDFPDVRGVHVYFNGLRPKPLRGGRAGRNADGDFGVLYGSLGDEDTRLLGLLD